MDSHSSLPFLIVYGAFVWKVVLVALTIGTMFALRRLHRWNAASWVRAVLARESETSTKLALGNVRLRARVRGGYLATLVGRNETLDHRSDDVWLEYEGRRIDFVGPVRVDYGSRAWKSRYRPVVTDLPELTSVAATAEARDVRRVADGDEVIIVGATAASADHLGQWTIAAESGPAVRVLSTIPVDPPRPLGASLLLAVVATGALWFGLLHYVGTIARDHLYQHHADEPAVEIDSFGRVAIAAALPGSRASALDEMARRLEDAYGRTGDNLPLLLAAARFADQCPFETALRAVRLEDALVIAHACGTPQQLATVLAFMGRFDEAAAALPADDHSDLATTIAIANGRWSAAALAVEAYADQPTHHNASASPRCLGALLRTYANETGTFARVTNKDSSVDCALMEAVSLPVAQQLAAIEAIRFEPEMFAQQAFARALAFAAGAPANDDRDDDPSEVLRSDAARLESLWLGPLAAATHTADDDRSQARIHRTLAALAIERGDFVQARAELEKLVGDDAIGASRTRELARAIEAREGDHPQPRGFDTDRLPFVADACAHRLVAALAAARAGDGGDLAATFRACQIGWGLAPMLYDLLPRIRLHRAELAIALRGYRDPFSTAPGAVAFSFLANVVVYRDLARLVGDDDEAQRWQAIFERYDHLLSDRQHLIAFIFWAQVRGS